MEGPNSTLYRTFLLSTLPILYILAFMMQLWAFAFLAVFFTLMIVSSFFLARRGLKRIFVRREAGLSAFEGDTKDVALLLENRNRRGMGLLEIRDRFGPSLSDIHALSEPGPVPANTIRRIEYVGYCSRHWGIYTLGPIEVTAADPFGFFRSKKTMPDVDVFSLFPRVYRVEKLEKLGSRSTMTSQELTAGRPGQSPLYFGVREYRSGDDPRRIHWPATARRGELTVKEFEVDLVPYFTLLLDLNRGFRAGTGRKSTLEYVVRTGASLLWSAARKGHFVQLFANDGDLVAIPPGHGEAHLTFALNELIQRKQEGTEPFHELVERSLPVLPMGSTAAMLFGTSTPEFGRVKEILERLRSRNVRPVMIFVNNHSFAPVDKWPMPRAEVVERQQELRFLLMSNNVPFSILEAEHKLEERIGSDRFLE